MVRSKSVLLSLLIWYVLMSLWVAYAPADRQFWILASILPAALVLFLIVTHRVLPLSHASYLSITLFLTLHMVGVRYTYAEVPAGLTLLTMVTIRTFRGHFTPEEHRGVEVPGIYWHFVDVMWVIVYSSVYVL